MGPETVWLLIFSYIRKSAEWIRKR